jgi:hypothetical protein
MAQDKTQHERIADQEEQFGPARDGDGFATQIVLLRINRTSDCRAWDWAAVIDEPDVTLIGWEGMDA